MKFQPAQLALVASLLSVVVSAVILIRPSTPALPVQYSSVSVPLLPKVDARDGKRFDSYGDKLQVALKRQDVKVVPAAMKLFDYQQATVVSKQPELEQENIYHLGMVYRSGSHNYALIDNKLYKRGERLPGGERIRKIDLSGVVIVKDGKKNVLRVKDYATAPINVPEMVHRRPQSMSQADRHYKSQVGAQQGMDAVTNALKMLQNTQRMRQEAQQRLQQVPGY